MGEELIYQILTHLESMNDRLRGLESDISGIKAGQSRLEADFTTVKAGQSRLETDVSAIKIGQSRLEADVTAVKTGQSRLEADTAIVKSSQIKLENNLTTKIDVLFDGWQQHEDYAARNTEHLDRLESKLDSLELATTKMAVVQDQHTDLLHMLKTRSATHENEILALKRAK
ncbi:hypothetical protein SDC9_04114 [bioreactor metagenome]|uniref:Uncharacterized protein n=1 Tax=bioreactor metagenome TaxID=1076179 RepID=A0A644SV52_9ZZZZ|nr:hypothetical protein [Negativicutes bacterium]